MLSILNLFKYLYIHVFGTTIATNIIAIYVVIFCFHIVYRLIGER